MTKGSSAGDRVTAILSPSRDGPHYGLGSVWPNDTGHRGYTARPKADPQTLPIRGSVTPALISRGRGGKRKAQLWRLAEWLLHRANVGLVISRRQHAGHVP